MPNDRYGLPLSTDATTAAGAYVEGIDRLLSGWSGAEQCFDRALAEDPDLALAHAAQARWHQIYGRMEDAKRATARARSSALEATRRERGHVEAIALLIEGAPAR